MTKKVIEFEITEEGDIQVNSTKLPGSEAEIMALLEQIAEATGGSKFTLKIEKHVHKPGGGHVARSQKAGAG